MEHTLTVHLKDLDNDEYTGATEQFVYTFYVIDPCYDYTLGTNLITPAANDPTLMCNLAIGCSTHRLPGVSYVTFNYAASGFDPDVNSVCPSIKYTLTYDDDSAIDTFFNFDEAAGRLYVQDDISG